MAKKHKKNARQLAGEYAYAKRDYHHVGKALRSAKSASERRVLKHEYTAAKRHYHAAGRALARARR